MAKLKENQLYCVKCRKAVTCAAKDLCVKMSKVNKRTGRKTPMLKCKCKKCGVKLSKFVSMDKVAKLRKKYGSC